MVADTVPPSPPPPPAPTVPAIRLLVGDAVRRKHTWLTALSDRIFTDFDPGYFADRLPRRDGLALHIAESDASAALGYKLGYRQEESVFYSWMGGVRPEARGRGIAAALMAAQHEWAAAQGYRWIETRTRAGNQAMLRANRRAGFAIIAEEKDEHGGMVLVQRKHLDAPMAE